ncbi:MAG: hypothetical protein MZW92_75770 [Comamonadaceae bacterium]|nr:hypothetical protein [Comamonadaceae bacterium]
MRFVLLDDVHGDERFGFTREQLDWLDGVLKRALSGPQVRLRPRAPEGPVPEDHPGPGLPVHAAARERAGLPRHPGPPRCRHGRVRAPAHPRLPRPQRRARGHHRGRRPTELPGAPHQGPLFTKKRHYSLIDILGRD